MKKWIILFATAVLLCFCGCTPSGRVTQIAATTLPVYDFTTVLCQGTGITVTRLITEDVSCLHDYTLQVSQMRTIEQADAVVISGAGLESFLDDALLGAQTCIDASKDIPLLSPTGTHAHSHGRESDHDHHHDGDPHIWLSPANAKHMAENICQGLISLYPEHDHLFRDNLTTLKDKIEQLEIYARDNLSFLSCRKLITFHDGFSYMAQAFDLEILHAVEEEAGSEASAAELIKLSRLVRQHRLPSVFTERSGSDSAASVIAAETGTAVYELDMAISGSSYWDAMKHNIDTLKEALG